MARRKKDDNAAGIILVIIGVVAWVVYVAVRSLININERFIESVSNPVGIIVLFLGLLIAGALIIRIFIYRGFRKKTTELEQAMSDLAQKEKAFDETVRTEVARGLYQEKKKLSGQWDDFHNARNKTSRALQRIVDSAYKFKVKTLLSGITVNNWQSKYDQLRKERDAYAAIVLFLMALQSATKISSRIVFGTTCNNRVPKNLTTTLAYFACKLRRSPLFHSL